MIQYKQIPFVPIPMIPNEQILIMYPIDGCDILSDTYALTNYGRLFLVHSVRKGCAFEELHPSPDEKGYLATILSCHSGRKRFFIHRLVALYYNYNPNHKDLVVNHIDGCRNNNYIGNLEWVTIAENTIHAVKTGLIKRSLDENTVQAIREDLAIGALSITEIAEKYNTTYHIVNGLSERRIYKDLEFADTFDKEIIEEASNIPPQIVLDVYNECKRILDDEFVAKEFNIPIRAVQAIRMNHPAYSSILGSRLPIKTNRKPTIDDETALAIYNDKNSGMLIREIATKYNVSEATIGSITTCQGAYSFLRYKYNLEPIKREKMNVSDELALQIYEMCKTKSNLEISNMTGISVDTIICIKLCKGKYVFLKDKYGLEPQQKYQKK